MKQQRTWAAELQMFSGPQASVREDFYQQLRKCKTDAEYSEVVVVYADWLEENGFPAIAALWRS